MNRDGFARCRPLGSGAAPDRPKHLREAGKGEVSCKDCQYGYLKKSMGHPRTICTLCGFSVAKGKTCDYAMRRPDAQGK